MRSLPLMLLLAASGCAYARVALPPLPPAEADEAQRRAAYEALVPVSRQESIRYYRESGQVVQQEVEHWQLGNGLQVEDPRDLLPAVKPRSVTARAAAAFGLPYERARWAFLGGPLGLGAGAGLFAGGFALVHGPSRAYVAGDTLMVSGGVVAAAALGVVIWGVVEWLAASRARLAAFAAYPHDLQRRLWFPLQVGAEPEPVERGTDR